MPRSEPILVVDDDGASRELVVDLLGNAGLPAVAVPDGEAALAWLEGELPSMILLDLMMPGVGGHEVLSRLKSDPETADIPVVIVTSRFVNDDERQQILTRAASVMYKGDLSRETVSRAIAEAMTPSVKDA